MTEERDGFFRLPPDQLAALERAMREGLIRVPRAPPSDVPTGIDARAIREAIQDVTAPLSDQIRELREKVADFLPEADIDEKVERAFSSIGLLVDTQEHREQTGEAVRGLLRYHKRADKIVSGLVMSILLAGVVAVLKLIGINVPPIGGGPPQ